MNNRKAEEFEEALQQADRGQKVEERFAPLVELVGRMAVLSQPPPPPPNRLGTGRQRFLTEASRLRAQEVKPKITRWKGRTEMRGAMKLVTALTVLVLFGGMALAAVPVMADSLPGDPLYGPKLALEQIRLALTRGPEAKAAVGLAVAERRLEEVIALIEQNRGVDEPTLNRVEQHLMNALRMAAQVQDPASSRALQRLALAIQERERTMTRLMDQTQQSGQEQLRQVLRIMERVRTEARSGQEDPNGLRQRLRQGIPPIPTGGSTPDHAPGPWQTPGSRTPTEPTRHGPAPQTPYGPGGPQSTDRPGPGPQPTQPPGGPNPTEPPDPGPQPSQPPGGPNPTEPPGPGPQPSQPPGGPNPTEPPDPGPQPSQP
ncbi:MAG: DUF5667 domain-containing protein, partial [Anaerolineae bacterium]